MQRSLAQQCLTPLNSSTKSRPCPEGQILQAEVPHVISSLCTVVTACSQHQGCPGGAHQGVPLLPWVLGDNGYILLMARML